MLYRLNEFHRALIGPAVHMAQASVRMLSPDGWFAHLPGAAQLAAGYELVHRLGREYEKPAFGIDTVQVSGTQVVVREQTVLNKAFCELKRFKRYSDDERVVSTMKQQPVVLVVAPLSGHHATLLRDTVRSLLADHDVYITDWIDARIVPLSQGAFSLDDYVAYVREFIRLLQAQGAASSEPRPLHVMAVCQPTVPVLAAVSLMAAAGEPTPRTMTLMGGPIDGRLNPTQVNRLATEKPLSWFKQNLLHEVPARFPGAGRIVYPGFLQHTGFIAMNPGRHMRSHWEFYQQLVQGDLDDAAAHRKFYDEYNAVLDMPAEYYIECVSVVFQEHLLPLGKWRVAGTLVRPELIQNTAVLTIEGELDDISGLGQTRAAHELCSGVPSARKDHITVEGAGHYGIFSGRRWRETVYPRVRAFMADHAG
jgi:poly(3-hydroxybutyrate) depolymerase